MPVGRVREGGLATFADLIETWAAEEAATNPLLTAIDRDAELRRWYIRMRGEDKAVITVWLTLGQRTLQYETYFMPAPEENVEACYAYVLRANARLFTFRFAIGAEDAIYLVGQMPLSALDAAELDRIVGSAYAYSEQYFRPAMRLGFESLFGG